MQRVVLDRWYRKYNYVLSIRCQQYELATIFHNNICKRRAFLLWCLKWHHRTQQRDIYAEQQLNERATKFEAMYVYAKCFSRWKMQHILQAHIHKAQKCKYSLSVQHKESSSNQPSAFSLLARLPVHGGRSSSSSSSNCSNTTIFCMTRNLRASRMLLWWSLQHQYQPYNLSLFSKQPSCVISHMNDTNSKKATLPLSSSFTNVQTCQYKVKVNLQKEGNANISCDNTGLREIYRTYQDKENTSPSPMHSGGVHAYANCANSNNRDEDDEYESATKKKVNKYDHLDSRSMYGLVDTPTRPARERNK